jgi:diguanylate cyclase (GGDEF)-like protein
MNTMMPLKICLRRVAFICFASMLMVKPVYASEHVDFELVLQLAELPFLLMTICACVFAAWALFRRQVALPAKQLGKTMILMALGFVVMGVGHLKMSYERAYSTNIFHTIFGEKVGDLLWLSALILTWLLMATSMILIVRFILKQHIHRDTQALRVQNKNLEKDANVDPLTNIWNRRFLFRDGENLINSLRENGESLCLLSMDLDHFKGINDLYGHAAGDAALKNFCEVVQANIRTDDVFARNGGEEFVLLLPRVSDELAHQIANRILESVEAQATVFQGEAIGFTVSMGFIHRDSVDMTMEELLIAADKALYEAKEEGRNRINTADVDNMIGLKRA